MAGSYAFQEPDSEDKSNVLSFTEALRIEDEGKSGKYEYAHAEHNRKQFLQPLLGRYDALSYAKTRMLSRGPQPFFPYDSQAAPPRIEDECVKERFPTFFLRQEMATRVSLRQMQTPADSQYPQPFIACIAVTLQRRAYRLDFLYRLLRCGAEDDKERLRSSLKEAGIRFEPQDYAFLTDGWGDILLMFMGDPRKERIGEIFHIQDVLFQDFMVDRTELLFAPTCADVVAAIPRQRDDESQKKFQLRIQVRLMEDRSLSRNNRRFVDEMNKILDNEKSNIGAENFTIAKVPGRMDFNIRFEPNEDASSSKNSVPFYKTLEAV